MSNCPVRGGPFGKLDGGQAHALLRCPRVLLTAPVSNWFQFHDHAILKRASASRLSGDWNDDDYDVLANGVVVGRIFKANAASVGSPLMWTLAFGHHEDRSLTQGYEATGEAAMAAFAKSWRRQTAAQPSRPDRLSTATAH